MALTLKLGYTAKKYNSTSRIWTNTDTQLVVLKEPTSLTHPVFLLSRHYTPINSKGGNVKADQNFIGFNYCRCDELKRYYFIKDMIFVNNDLVEIHCDVDVLASYVDLIKETEAFVKYTSDTKYADGTLDDGRLVPEKAIAVPTKALIENSYPWSTSSVTYALDVTSILTGCGCNITYLISPSNMAALINEVAGNMASFTVSDADSFFEMLGTVFGGNGAIADYMHNLRILPFPYNEYSGTETKINIGMHTYDTKGKLRLKPESNDIKVLALGANLGIMLPLPNDTLIPKNKTSGDLIDPFFLRGQKYIRYMLRHPNGFMEFSTDAFCINEDFKIDFRFAINKLSGEYDVQLVYEPTKDFLGNATGNISFNLGDLFNGQGAAAAGAQFGAKMGVAIGGAAVGLMRGGMNPSITTSEEEYAIETKGDASYKTGVKKTNSTSKGSFNLGIFGEFFGGGHNLSSGSSMSNPDSWLSFIAATVDFDTTTQADKYLFEIIGVGMLPNVCMDATSYATYTSLYGYPCSKILTLGDIKKGSFVQCSNANVILSAEDFSGTTIGIMPEEVSQINNFLNTGIYLVYDS